MRNSDMRERVRSVARLIVRRSVMIAGTTWLVLALLALPVAGFALFGGPLKSQISDTLDYTTVRGDDSSSNRILALSVKGDIDGEPADAANPDPGVAYGYTIADQLEKAAGDDGIKAVVLVVDSPGGTIYGARAIADAVDSYREKTKRPVITEVAGAADSGAYWAAASTDAIIADYGTDIGSIGVISGPFRTYTGVTSLNDPVDGQVTAANISSFNITAGAGKDEGDPYRKLTPEEQANIQRGVDNDYAAFVSFVATRRHIAADTIRGKIGAYSYDPTTALSLKLIDKIGGRDAAFGEAAMRAGIKGDDYQVVEPAEASATASPSAPAGQSAAACRLPNRVAAKQAPRCYNK